MKEHADIHYDKLGMLLAELSLQEGTVVLFPCHLGNVGRAKSVVTEKLLVQTECPYVTVAVKSQL